MLVALLCAGFTSAWGGEEVYKTALFGSSYNSKGVSGYSNVSFSATNAGFTVDVENFNNNNNGWTSIKCGGKNGAYTGTIITAAPIDKAITKVNVTIDAITADNVTSIKLYTSSDKQTWSEAGSFSKTTGVQSVTLASPTANLYYKIEFVCTKGSSNGLVTVSKVEYYFNDSGSTPTDPRTSVTLSFSEETWEVTLGGVGLYPDLSVDPATAESEVVYTSSNSTVAEVANNGVVNAKAAGTTTITASITDSETYQDAEASYELTVIDPNAPGTQNNPYTVAQAKNNTPTTGTSDNVYIKGIVSKFYGNNIMSDGTNYRYYISDDGTTNNQLLVYKGNGLNNVAFSNANDLQVGDEVVIYGKLRKYTSIYEIEAGNFIVSLTRKEVPTLTFSEDQYSVVKNGNLTITATSNSSGTITYTSSNTDVAEVNATTGAITAKTAGTTNITATIAATDDYKSATATVELTVTAPKHTVTFYQNGTKLSEEEVVEDAAIEFPVPAAELYGKRFVGWTTTVITEPTNTKPTLVTSATMGTADVNYYAVYANQEGENTLSTATLTANDNWSGYSEKTIIDDKGNNWTGVIAGQKSNGVFHYGLTKPDDKKDPHLTSPIFDYDITDVKIVATNGSSKERSFLLKDGESEVGTITVNANTSDVELTASLNDIPFKQFTLTASDALQFKSISVTYGTPATYSDYCTTVVKPVAKIANKGYATLQEAVDAAEEGATIDIVDDFTLTTVTASPSDKYNVNVNKSVTINGNNHVITASEGKRGIVLEGEGLDVTIKDLTIKSNKAEACLWIASNLTCTLDNTVLDGTNGKSYNQPLTIGSIDAEGRVKLNVTNGSVIKTNDAGTAHYAIIAWHPADITVTGSKLIGWANVYLKPDAEGSTVKIENSEMKSQGLSGNSNNFATITTECNNSTIEVKDTKITSAAVDGTYMSLLTLGGEGNVVKLLGETTYETNSKEWGAITFNWGSLFKNKLYLDDTTKEALAEYFDGSHQETVDPADETGLYPVSFVPEVYYYWPVEGGYQGGYYNFAEPFENGWLADGEFIALQKNVTLTENITCQLASGTSFNFLLGDYNVTKGDYSVSLKTGVTVLTDKQTDIFSAAEAGYKIVESTTEEGYSYTAEQIQLSAPIIFHDSGEYESELQIAMAGEGTIMYTLNDGEAQTYSAPFTITEDATIKAWAVKDGVASDVTEPKTFTIKEKAKGAVVEDGYYTIQTNEGKYVNVAGRKTVTLVSDTKSAGTVIRVKAEEDGVKVLRSQAVDLPRYAERAMSYVPELVKEVVKKLAANVDDPIIGEQGADLILDKFNKEFDYHLYLEGENNTYRIYGRTPSMKPVVDFYAENKELVDSRLPKLEGFVEEILLKVAERLHHPDSDWAKKFKVHNIWALIVNEENKLTEPVDEASTAKFFTEVLSSEANIWNFAHETAMIYWTKVEQLINDPDPDSESDYADMLENLGDYKKYLEKIPQIRPNFKYYIVSDGSGIDFISEGNEDIINNAARTVWTLTPRTEFDVTFLKDNALSSGRELYTTLYTDFAYELPDGVKAYAITGVNETTGFATKEEFPSNIIPAQTPVLLQATFDAEQTADQTKTLELTTEAGTTPETNLLVGADELINQYEINSSTVVTLLDILSGISQSLADQYNYLARKNAGTVNNKYFFGLTEDDLNLCTYKNENNENDCVVRSLSMGDEKLGFYNNWEAKANQAFLINEINPVKLFLKGDIDRDGDVDNNDLKALVEIVLEKVTVVNNPDDYDFEAAHVNDDEDIDIADVTALVNILNE